ncbi:MAG: hypothetical protein ACXADU_10490 [Promethearchaeota archaeon]
MSESPSRISRYRNLIIIFILYCIFWIVLVTILRDMFQPVFPLALTRFIPLDDALIELSFMFTVVLPISSIIGIIIGGYCVTPLILVLHKKIIGSKMHYGYQKEKSNKPQLFSRAFFPVLMAINLSSMFLTPTTIEFIIERDLINEIDDILKVPILSRFLAQIILLTITFGIAAFLFSAVWYLKDSGIIYSNKQKIINSDETFVLKTIGDWYQTILRSYAGIGAIITYILVIYNFLGDFADNLADRSNIVNILSLILWLGLPFYLAISIIPALILNDFIKKNRINYIKKIGKKLGIRDSIEVSFDFTHEERD